MRLATHRKDCTGVYGQSEDAIGVQGGGANCGVGERRMTKPLKIGEACVEMSILQIGKFRKATWCCESEISITPWLNAVVSCLIEAVFQALILQ